MGPSSCGSYVQSQSIEHTTSVSEARMPVMIVAATPRFTSWRMSVQFGRAPKMFCSDAQVPSLLPSSTKTK